jgi:hypothetical protein
MDLKPGFASTMTRQAMVGIAIVGIVLLGVPTYAVEDRQISSISITETQDGHIVRYRDPASDGAWREYFLRDASRLFVDIHSNVTTYAGHWQYDYSVTNSSSSSQDVEEWSLQAALGSDVFTPPSGWDVTRNGAGEIRWLSVEKFAAIPPGGTMSGWTLVSDALPEVQYARVRGIRPPDSELSDLPREVRERILELDQSNAQSVPVIAPWFVAGNASALDEVLARLRVSYAAPLQDPVYAEDARVRNGREALTYMERAQLALKGGRPDEARSALGQAKRLLGTPRADPDWVDSMRSALSLTLDYVIGKLPR